MQSAAFLVLRRIPALKQPAQAIAVRSHYVNLQTLSVEIRIPFVEDALLVKHKWPKPIDGGESVMRTLVSLAIVMVLIAPMLSLAQGAHDRCPADLTYVGTLKGTESFVELLDKTFEIELPENATLDTPYQQTKLVADGGKGARSKLRPQDVPKGIHIVPYGQGENGKAWVVSDPRLKTVPEADGKTRYVFGMHLHCTVDEFARQFGGCAVNVDVCYKPPK